MATYFSDLHCHSTLFNFNRKYKDTWYEHYFPIYPAQGNFAQMARGKVRVVMTSMYPIEQGFVSAKQFGPGKITDFLAKMIVSIPKERTNEIQAFEHDYFEDYKKEFDFLKASADPITEMVFVNPFWLKTYKYKLVRDFADIKNILGLDDDLNPGAGCDDTIAVVIASEGAHILGVGEKNTLTKDPDLLKVKLRNNIDYIKKMGPAGDEGAWCPFFISLSHHFWNQLGGHAVSLWGTIRKVLDQEMGINENVTELGKFVVEELLDNTNGKRRILIDSIHMSYKLRCWYYNYLAERALAGDKIPVVISHTGCNGKSTMAEAEMHGDPSVIHNVADKLYAKSTEFNPWDNLVSDEEIMIVHNSEGIIGLILDERIMMGKKTLDQIKKDVFLRTKWKKRHIWIQPFINQIMHIARHIMSETGDPTKIWDNMSVGSDFNGMITPIKAFNTADEFSKLNNTLFLELKDLRETDALLTGKTDAEIQEIVDKIMWKNNLRFLEKHYHF